MNNIFDLYSSCSLCPKKCNVNRNNEIKGFCRESNRMRIACACLHQGEEPPLIGKKGSGTVFFTGCTLKCSFCQNFQISRQGMGDKVSEDTLSQIFLSLQNRDASNINLVTGTHFIPGIIKSLDQAKAYGLTIPVLWNSSGYEEINSLRILNDSIDIYLPDLKTLDTSMAGTLFKAKDYPAKAKQTILYMINNKSLHYENDKLKKGVIIRHLVLPGYLDSTRAVLRWYSQEVQGRALISIMFQYIPEPSKQHDLKQYNAPLKCISQKEYNTVLMMLEKYNLEDGFIQEPAGKDTWIPDFRKSNPFPPDFADPVWHFLSNKN